jgi:alpha-tubulin suppressor-like RCC1 family protein
LKIDSNGWLWSFGNNAHGDRVARLTPTRSSLTNIKSIAAGIRQVIALDFNGDVWCFGSGKDTVSTLENPTKISGIKSPIKMISFGYQERLALDVEDRFWSITHEPNSAKILTTGLDISYFCSGGYTHIVYNHAGQVFVFGAANFGELGASLDQKRTVDLTAIPEWAGKFIFPGGDHTIVDGKCCIEAHPLYYVFFTCANSWQILPKLYGSSPI